MAGALRIGVSKLLARNSAAGLCKITQGGNATGARMQVALISGKVLRGTDKKRPAPYPYETKRFTLWDSFFDKTLSRIDENSKIIVVEGPIASGKTALAKELAADLGMRYMPAITMDSHYINSYGYDLRQLDPQLPVSCRSYDVKNFCENPHHLNCANYQILMYYHRYAQYIDALAHLMSTGEGIVMERCAYSDIVFLEAMYNAGYISKDARETYHDLKDNTLPELLLPHLVIYLDVPVPIVKENIKKRGIPYEVQSKTFTDEYLLDIENIYKQQYLKEMARHANILIYDWSDGGDGEVVIEDIERLNFVNDDKDDPKFKTWQFWDEGDWSDTRRTYADQKEFLLTDFGIGYSAAPELHVDGNDYREFLEVWDNAPGQKFMKGYNADMGDTGILWKVRQDDREYRVKIVE